VVGAEPAQFCLAVSDLMVELVDQAQARRDRTPPRLGQRQPREQFATADTEQVGDGTGLAVREQHGVDTLLQAGAVAHEVETSARPFPLGAHRWVGQPNRRHEIAAAELGEHPGVDPVGLAGQRRKPLTFCASAISTCQPACSSRSCTKRAPFIDSIAAQIGEP
jgi:hypothetical protein